ncbi:hypothetical protein DFP75_103115 [Marinomonas alcarazii]|uniref:HTH cro/C1-type domain-containing protein n=1 Tax=Marinomonas alcarazii TaxID=491949 RepID=A0A318VEN1_9GAMM|nr:transcriptional regulator [Marinomonas alcarazii]PYF82289.1 hypothetical protein DFP75_103115 [Marinomonas alcarazii]
MKMKDLLDSAQPMKKHKSKSKKNELKKKKQEKLEAKKQAKTKKEVKAKKPAEVTKKPAKVLPEDSSTTSNPIRQRASKSLEPMTNEEQLIAINQIIKRLLMNEITQGMALRELRVSVLGLRQDAYTKLTGVSRKTLSEIENDKGNYTTEIINKVFKPFEIKVGLVPTSSQLLAAIMAN